MTITRRTLIVSIAVVVAVFGGGLALGISMMGASPETASGPTKLVCEVTGSNGEFLGQRDAENTAWPCGMDLPEMKEGDTVPGLLGAEVTLKRIPADQPPSQLTK